MKLLPIVERELRVAARRRATHGARFGVALVALGVLFWVLWIRGSASASPQETGKVLFAVLSPERLVSGAAHKWKSLTRDSLVLERVETQRSAAEIAISWPEHILPPLVARSLMEGVRAALELSGAQHPTIELHDLTPTGARYSLRWG